MLANMGHGDESSSPTVIPVRFFHRSFDPLRWTRVPEVLEAVLKFLPLDDFVEHPPR
ncbi:MAG: hypothetical protein ACLT0Y_05540 [Christensenellales bacterium]